MRISDCGVERLYRRREQGIDFNDEKASGSWKHNDLVLFEYSRIEWIWVTSCTGTPCERENNTREIVSEGPVMAEEK